eukprot:jgi/Galph1/1218/GphlegSOOS_G6024.1
MKVVRMGPGGKIHREEGKTPDALEIAVAQAFVDLANASSEESWKELALTAARELDAQGGKKVIVIHVPYKQNSLFRKVHNKLVRELEKKFSGKTIVFVAQRKILPKEKKGRRLLAKRRPISRTLTAVHDAILEDIAYPVDIVGKRVRYRQDGSRLIKVLLDPKEQHNVEHKLDALQTAYKKLTGKDVVFQFPTVSSSIN